MLNPICFYSFFFYKNGYSLCANTVIFFLSHYVLAYLPSCYYVLKWY